MGNDKTAVKRFSESDTRQVAPSSEDGVPDTEVGAFAVSTETHESVRRSRERCRDDQSTFTPDDVVEGGDEGEEDSPEPAPPIPTEQAQLPRVPIAAEVTESAEALKARVDALQARMNRMEQPLNNSKPAVVSAQQVHPLSEGAAVAIDVEPHSGEALSLTSQDDYRRKRKRLWLAFALLMVLLAALIAVIVAVVIPDEKGANPTSVVDPPSTFPPVPDGPIGWKPLGQEIQGIEVADFVGHSVSLSGDASTLVVGAPEGSETSGRVTVYHLDVYTQVWIPVGQVLRGEGNDYRFGWSVSCNGDGNVIAVGAIPRFDFIETLEGYVAVYELDKSSSSWKQVGSDILGVKAGEGFGASVSLSAAGDIVAVGAVVEENTTSRGYVRLFNREENSETSAPWKQMGQTLEGEGIEDRFGKAVSLSSAGTIVGVGAYDNGEDFEGQASAFQYQYDTNTWVPMGDPLHGDTSGERFGFSVDLDDSGMVMAVGARWGKGDRKGSVSVFDFDAFEPKWTRRGQIVHGKADYDLFGWTVSMSSDGNRVAGGARFNDDNGNNTGQVRIFEYYTDNSTWVQVGSDLNGVHPHEEYGKSISLAGNTTSVIACGGPYHNNRRGHAEVFSFH